MSLHNSCLSQKWKLWEIAINPNLTTVPCVKNIAKNILRYFVTNDYICQSSKTFSHYDWICNKWHWVNKIIKYDETPFTDSNVLTLYVAFTVLQSLLAIIIHLPRQIMYTGFRLCLDEVHARLLPLFPYCVLLHPLHLQFDHLNFRLFLLPVEEQLLPLLSDFRLLFYFVFFYFLL